MNIYLIGFMATGKSSVGRTLARRKKWNFLDLDDLIELREKRTIKDIFAKEGEAHFRRLERKMLEEVSREKRFVIACGGGIVLAKDNIRVMRKTGRMVCLKANVDVILKRIEKSTHRPLLNVSDQKRRIETLLNFRKPFYDQADYSIITSNLTIKQVVDKIIDRLKTK